MSRQRKDPLRPLTDDARVWLERIRRATMEPSSHVARCGAYLRHPLQLHRTHIHLRDQSILVMKTAQNWKGHDGALGAHRATCGIRHFREKLADALVRSRAIEVIHVLIENATQVSCAHDQHVIEAVTPNAP